MFCFVCLYCCRRRDLETTGVVAALDTWNRWNTTHEATAAGLVLLAADVQENIGGCGITDFSVTDLPMAQVLASNDGTLNRTRTAQNRRYNSNATQFVEIYGANHASVGTILYYYYLLFEKKKQITASLKLMLLISFLLKSLVRTIARNGPTWWDTSMVNP